jgi:hypothetical protein
MWRRLQGAGRSPSPRPTYDAGRRFYHDRSGLEPHRIEAIVLIRVDVAAPLISPAYDDGSTEREVERRSLELYGLERV